MCSTFVFNKSITSNERDPSWINHNIKTKIECENSNYKTYKRNAKKMRKFPQVKNRSSLL